MAAKGGILLLDLSSETLVLICANLLCLEEMRLLMSTKRLAAHAAEAKKARRLAVLRAFESIVARANDFLIESKIPVNDVYSEVKYTEKDKMMGMKRRMRYPCKGLDVYVVFKWYEDFLLVEIRSTYYDGSYVSGKYDTRRIIYPHKGTMRNSGGAFVERPMQDLFNMLDCVLCVGV